MKEISKFLETADAPDATTTTPVVASPDGAATVPATTAPKPGEVSSTPKGPIPFEVHTTALENARTKAVDSFRQQFGIAPQVTPETFQKGIGFARAIDANPIQFMEQLAENIRNHPVWGPQLRSSAGRTLATPAPTRPEADIEVRNEQGHVVGTSYSATQTAKLLEWERAEMKGEFSQMIQPFQQERDQRLQREQSDAFQKEADAGAQSELTRVNEILEGKTELGPEVAKLMAQGVNHIDAALQVRKQFIVPNAAKAAEAAVLDIQLKKVAGNTVNGSGPSASKPKFHPGMSRKEFAAALREADQATA